MTRLIDLRRVWGNISKEKLIPQEIPSVDDLIRLGAEETGDHERGLPDGRDSRTWSITNEFGMYYMTYIPDEHGFYLENITGSTWRPANIQEAIEIFDQYAREEVSCG